MSAFGHLHPVYNVKARCGSLPRGNAASAHVVDGFGRLAYHGSGLPDACYRGVKIAESDAAVGLYRNVVNGSDRKSVV